MDRLVTVFGGGGFLGRYVVQQLCKAGARVRVAQNDPRRAFFLKPLGMPGQIQFVAADVRNADRVAAAMINSTAVINLVGVLKGDFQGIHVDGARNIATGCASHGVSALVHVSAIGADPNSRSAYGRTKGLGEQMVQESFAPATIIRPSILFGREDNFVNRFAGMARLLPFLPVVRGSVRLQPVYAADVAKAITAAALDPKTHAGKDYELGGPQVLTMRELMEWICKTTNRNRRLINVPDGVAAAAARLTGWLPGAPITWDQWLMLQDDNVASGKAKGLEAFSVPPTPLAAVSEGWLTAYRRNGRFAAKSPY